VKVSGRVVTLPKLGRFKFFRSREIEGEMKSVSVVRRGYHWHISFQCEITKPDPIHPSSTRVGIDLGIKRLATLSDGTFSPPQNNLAKQLSRLAFEQRKLSRKQKRSKNWRKQKQRLAKLHAQIADTRRDYLHKITTEISKNHAVVCVEDLQVSQMSGSGKRSLNRAILDQGWYEFRRQLEYKLSWRGGILILVAPEYTSQTCPSCGHVDAANRPSLSRFECVVCPYTGHADVVGAMNILAVGHTVSACGDTGPMRALAQESSRL
jgi:putative transposase